MLPNVPWYQERRLHQTSLGSLMIIILVRTVKYNLSKLRVRLDAILPGFQFIFLILSLHPFCRFYPFKMVILSFYWTQFFGFPFSKSWMSVDLYGYIVLWHSYCNRISIFIQIAWQLWQIWHHMLTVWVHMHHNSWLAFLICFHGSESHLYFFVIDTFKCLNQKLIPGFLAPPPPPNVSIFRYNKLAELKNDKMNIANDVLSGDNFLVDPVSPFIPSTSSDFYVMAIGYVCCINPY